MAIEVIVATKGSKEAHMGWPTLSPWNPVVEVASGRRHAAAGEDAGVVASLDLASLPGVGAPSGDSVVNG